MDRPRRPRRDRADLRELILQAALVEFARHGFEGASTYAIARRVDAHQPQINYHFDSKESLWEHAVEYLFALLASVLGPIDPDEYESDPALARAFADTVRRFVHFAAEHPELNRIMLHEATAESRRLNWMVEKYVREIYEGTSATWQRLRRAGIAAPVDATFVYYVIVGSATLPFVNAPEARILTGSDPVGFDWVDSHATGIVAMLLPGLGNGVGGEV